MPPQVVERAVRLQTAHQGRVLKRLNAVLFALWAQVTVEDPLESWASLEAQATGAFVAAQLAVAATADGYLNAVSDAGQPATPVGAAAFAGETSSGLEVHDLLAIPAARYAGSDRGPRARLAAQRTLALYGRTEVSDAGRNSVQAGMIARRQEGWVRVVSASCCGRCAILAGRVYRWSSGFDRHPGCRCSNIPTESGVESPSPRDLFLNGQVRDATDAELEAIRMGADPSQVINARQGVYEAGGRQFTRAGTTRRGVAGARILAREMARAGGAAPGGTYRNFSVNRRQVERYVAAYAQSMVRGRPFVRRTPTGLQTAAYRYTASGRMTVAEILATSPTQDDAVRQFINHGYLL